MLGGNVLLFFLSVLFAIASSLFCLIKAYLFIKYILLYIIIQQDILNLILSNIIASRIDTEIDHHFRNPTKNLPRGRKGAFFIYKCFILM